MERQQLIHARRVVRVMLTVNVVIMFAAAAAQLVQFQEELLSDRVVVREEPVLLQMALMFLPGAAVTETEIVQLITASTVFVRFNK